MAFRFFTIPALDPARAERELNEFLATQRVAAVERQFVADGASSFWSVCVTTAAREAVEEKRPITPEASRPRVDYKQVLTPEEFRVYARLRELRKELAAREGIPPYAVFRNDQLAQMVRGPVRSRAELGRIEGVGPTRLDKYAARFLEVLSAELGTAESHAPEGSAGPGPSTDGSVNGQA